MYIMYTRNLYLGGILFFVNDATNYLGVVGDAF